jgi:large subunit ribosomal protein L17
LLALLTHGKIETTDAKAKELRVICEKTITLAKKGGLARIRLAERDLKDKEVLHKLFTEIGPRFAERAGGYTRIIKLSRRRHGDNAPMSLVELVEGSGAGAAHAAPSSPASKEA